MRFNYYRFPEDTPEEVLLQQGCAVILKNGSEIYPESISDDKRELVDHIDTLVGPMGVASIKRLMKKYGGSGWTQHCDRDGSLFEVTPIRLEGNNTEFHYNRHL